MELNLAQIIEKINSVKHWYHRIEIIPGLITPGINDTQTFLKLLDLPNDCSGLKVLDLGTRDGFFAFELEKRGAEVLAIDYYSDEQTGFKVVAELLGSKVKFIQDNIYNVSVNKYGIFDIVLCLGLIYHLPDPLRALNIIRSVCKNELYLETQVLDNAILMPDGNFVSLKSISEQLEQLSIMQFYPSNSLNSDFSNFWAPNMKCMENMLIETNFSVLGKKLYGQRGLFKCKVTFDECLNYQMKIATGISTPQA